MSCLTPLFNLLCTHSHTLAEFYPESLRSRIAAQGEQKASKKTTRARKRAPKKQARVFALPAVEEQKTAVS